MYIKIIIAFILDLIIGDPKYRFHPVRIIGNLITYFEIIFRDISKNQKLNGILFASFIISISSIPLSILLFFLSSLGYTVIQIINFLIIIYFIYSLLSIKDLCKKAKEIHFLLSKKKIVKARQKLSLIVGRDTKDLNIKEIIRATIETISENTVDGIISPLFYCFLGGVPLMIIYKSINTLDSMVGYKNKKYIDFGWASARIDDIFNFIPARISGILIPLSFFMILKNGFRSFKIVIRDGNKNPSPNSGIPEAAFAGGLGVQLGGINYYKGEIVIKPDIGDKLKRLNIKHIKDSIKIVYISSILFLIIGLLFLFLINYLSGKF